MRGGQSAAVAQEIGKRLPWFDVVGDLDAVHFEADRSHRISRTARMMLAVCIRFW
jgi:hypothetical protein